MAISARTMPSAVKGIAISLPTLDQEAALGREFGTLSGIAGYQW
jgi:hypothetical protein